MYRAAEGIRRAVGKASERCVAVAVVVCAAENDDRIGVDFQNWKNNEGADFFSVGGRMRNNWSALYNTSGGMGRGYGSERTSFYNFNPKWNTRYLDFLVSKGKAKISHTGELLIRNNTPATLERTTQIFYVDVSNPVQNLSDLPDTGVGPYELLSALIGEIRKKDGSPADTVENGNFPVGKGNSQVTTRSTGYGFTMTVSNASSLIGFQSSGQPRISQPSIVSQDVSLPFGRDRFVIGGLRKQEKVESTTGIPWLMDLPWIGLLFSTRSTSVKHSELIVVADCSWDSPDDKPQVNGLSRRTVKP